MEGAGTRMEQEGLKMSRRAWWFAVGCVALAVYVVAAGVWSAVGGLVMATAVLNMAVQAAAMWWEALTPVAACMAAWWACLRFARSVGRPFTARRGRLAALGCVIAVVAAVSLFNTCLAAGLKAWYMRWAPPLADYSYPIGLQVREAVRQNMSVKVGMDMSSLSAAANHAAHAWRLTSECFRSPSDEPDGWDDDSLPDPFFENLRTDMEECRTEADIIDRYGPPQSRFEQSGDIVVCDWDWGGPLAAMDHFEGCVGFSAGIVKETGKLRWWSPSWLNHVPEGVPECFFVGEEAAAPEE